jgi:DNA polymerase II large subunit
MIGTSVDKLRSLGYTHDIYGNPLTSPTQICELKHQDIIIPQKAALEYVCQKPLNKICRFLLGLRP